MTIEEKIAKLEEIAKADTPKSETKEQIDLFNWIVHKKMLDKRYNMIFAIPNGNYRKGKSANILTLEGVVAGVPDIFIDVAENGYHGLRIELKQRHSGKVSDVQKRFIKDYNDRGYMAVVCHGAYEAMKVIKKYFGEKE